MQPWKADWNPAWTFDMPDGATEEEAKRVAEAHLIEILKSGRSAVAVWTADADDAD